MLGRTHIIGEYTSLFSNTVPRMFTTQAKTCSSKLRYSKVSYFHNSGVNMSDVNITSVEISCQTMSE